MATNNDREWDVPITPNGGGAMVRFPVELGKALAERELWRAKVSVTATGILIAPYASERRGRSRPAVDLPEWQS